MENSYNLRHEVYFRVDLKPNNLKLTFFPIRVVNNISLVCWSLSDVSNYISEISRCTFNYRSRKQMMESCFVKIKKKKHWLFSLDCFIIIVIRNLLIFLFPLWICIKSPQDPRESQLGWWGAYGCIGKSTERGQVPCWGSRQEIWWGSRIRNSQTCRLQCW